MSNENRYYIGTNNQEYKYFDNNYFYLYNLDRLAKKKNLKKRVFGIESV